MNRAEAEDVVKMTNEQLRICGKHRWVQNRKWIQLFSEGKEVQVLCSGSWCTPTSDLCFDGHPGEYRIKPLSGS